MHDFDHCLYSLLNDEPLHNNNTYSDFNIEHSNESDNENVNDNGFICKLYIQ